jgi:hypothetical protein
VFFWKEALKHVLHSMQMGLAPERSVRTFMQRLDPLADPKRHKARECARLAHPNATQAAEAAAEETAEETAAALRGSGRSSARGRMDPAPTRLPSVDGWGCAAHLPQRGLPAGGQGGER